MKREWKKPIILCCCLFVLFLCITYWNPFVAFLGVFYKASTPLVAGAFIAFIVNILMARYESWFLPQKQQGVITKLRRPICMMLAFVTVLGVLALVIWLIVPQLLSCIQLMLSFAMKIPDYIKNFITKAENWDFIPDKVLDYLAAIDWESKIGQFVAWITTGVGDVVNTVAKTVMNIVSGVITGVLSLIFSIYLLLEKDKVKRQLITLTVTYVPEKLYKKTFYFLRILKDSFSKFIVGQVTEALILGVLCTLGMLILGLPYATMIGALIAFTALIPIAGAYIGAVTGALMILMESPAKALAFLIFILILQQLEGNIIYPRVVGSSIGLPGIWVLVAVTVGGGCFGIPGMLIGVPLFSAIYNVLKTDVGKRNKKETAEEKPPELPVEEKEEKAEASEKNCEKN